MSHCTTLNLRFYLLVYIGICSSQILCAQVFGNSWPEITEAEWALSEPKIDPEAGAEYLLREIDVNHRAGSTYNFFYRLKFFTQKGVDEMKTIYIPMGFRQKISKIHARVAYPDGTINEVESDAIYTRTTVKTKTNNRNRHKTSFSLPGLKPGCIVDITYTMKASESGLRYLYGYTLLAYADYPTHKLTYMVKLYEHLGAGITSVGIPTEKFHESARNTRYLELENLPANGEKLNYMPPMSAVSPWMAFYYLSLKIVGKRNTNELYWKGSAQTITRWTKENIITPKDIRTKAKALTDGINEPHEKLKALYTFCQDQINNTSSDSSIYSYEQLQKMPEIKSAEDVLEHGFGDDNQIDYLFGSFAKSIGFDARIARVSDRTEYVFEKTMLSWDVLPDLYIAVKTTPESDWNLYSPGTPYLPFGEIEHWNEGTIAFTGNKKEPIFFPTPAVSSNNSKMKRLGTFELKADGTLTGKVTFKYAGHLSRITKEDLDDLSSDDQLDWVLDEVTDHYGQAIVTELKIINLDSYSKDLQIEFQLEIPQFAEQTSTRLFFKPSVFTNGSTPVFLEETRKYPIYFDILPNEFDQYVFKFPEGYELELPTSPGGAIDVDAIKHKIVMGMAKDSGDFVLKRDFVVNALMFGSEHYPAVKAIYDEMNKQDHHVISLKKTEE